MAQVSWRADDRLVERVKRAASDTGRSMNEFVTLVLDVATDPMRAGTEAERVRERLLHAGLLIAPTRRTSRRPNRAAVKAASRRAAKGTALSDLVSEGR
jgi:hypothetical protein